MNERHDAVVIGAGPAGAIIATLLARAGWAVALLERQAFPRRKVCGECIAATNLPLLEQLGVGEEFARRAGPLLDRVALMAGAHTVCAPLPPMPGRYPWGRALGREHLDPMLLECARSAGATVLQPWTVQAVRSVGDGAGCEVSVVSSAGSRESLLLRARLVIAAHGSWQLAPAFAEANTGEELAACREGTNDGRQMRPGDLFAFKANFRKVALEEGLLPVLALPGGYGGMVVAEDGLATLACCIRRDRLDALRRAAPGWSAGQAVEAWLRASTVGVRAALDGAQREGSWLGAGPIRPGIRMKRYQAARELCIFPIGNAAGEAHPIIGEGISMAMQSAWMLSRHLLAGGGVPDAQALLHIRSEYAADWHRQFAFRIRFAAAAAHLAMHPWLAPALLPMLQGAPALLTQAARVAGKVRKAAALPGGATQEKGSLSEI